MPFHGTMKYFSRTRWAWVFIVRISNVKVKWYCLNQPYNCLLMCNHWSLLNTRCHLHIPFPFYFSFHNEKHMTRVSCASHPRKATFNWTSCSFFPIRPTSPVLKKNWKASWIRETSLKKNVLLICFFKQIFFLSSTWMSENLRDVWAMFKILAHGEFVPF